MTEVEIQVKEIKEFQFGDNKEKTGYNVIAKDGETYTTFSSTDINQIKQYMDFPEEKFNIKYDVSPSKDPQYPDKKMIKGVADRDGNYPEKKSGGGGGYSKKDVASIERQVAIKGAIELCVHERIEVKELSTYADKIIDWIQKNK